MGSAFLPSGPNAVHLCVDMKNLLAPGGQSATPSTEKVLPSISGWLRTRLREQGSPGSFRPAKASYARGLWREYYQELGECDGGPA
jgi:hypothetical protein